ncbi:MAG: TRAP transporter substrate-binding protein, partial [Betaproteobacteria bacterium]|nr:TRAP transporter substrate-binding protein [Betaproteobacteria bacterium]
MFKRALVLLVAGLMAALGTAAWSQVKEIPWGTAAVGSSGHRALVGLAEVLNREMPGYRITVQPATGAIITM